MLLRNFKKSKKHTFIRNYKFWKQTPDFSCKFVSCFKGSWYDWRITVARSRSSTNDIQLFKNKWRNNEEILKTKIYKQNNVYLIDWLYRALRCIDNISTILRRHFSLKQVDIFLLHLLIFLKQFSRVNYF